MEGAVLAGVRSHFLTVVLDFLWEQGATSLKLLELTPETFRLLGDAPEERTDGCGVFGGSTSVGVGISVLGRGVWLPLSANLSPISCGTSSPISITTLHAPATVSAETSSFRTEASASSPSAPTTSAIVTSSSARAALAFSARRGLSSSSTSGEFPNMRAERRAVVPEPVSRDLLVDYWVDFVRPVKSTLAFTCRWNSRYLPFLIKVLMDGKANFRSDRM